MFLPQVQPNHILTTESFSSVDPPDFLVTGHGPPETPFLIGEVVCKTLDAVPVAFSHPDSRARGTTGRAPSADWRLDFTDYVIP